VEREFLDHVRRYLAARQSAGMDVAFRVAGAGRDIASAARGGTSAEPRSSLEAPAPRTAEKEIALITSPAPDEASAHIGKKAGIRFTREHAPAEQAALFEEPGKKDRFDLSGMDLAALDTAVSKCTRCALAGGRTKTVFGSGEPASRIVFIGEAPGREEDLQGLPFVGRAGQLLTKILAAIGFTRDQVYITNILKCRPPGNRDPQEDEMAACEPYLVRQLELINPVIICALGRIAGHGLLKKGASLAFLRQGIHYYNDIPVAVTYHPAALLRNPNLKRDAWEDFQSVRRLYDEAIREGA